MAVKRPKQIKSIDEFDEPKNILVYGDPGCGKTPFGASATKGLMITTEAGTISARRLGHRSVDVWPCHDDWNEVVKAFRWLADNSDMGAPMNEQPHGYEWVIIDNATQMQEIMLRDIIAVARRTNSNLDEDIPALQHYQKWYLQFDRFVKSFNNMPVNTLWLAHTMRKTNEDGEDLVLPAIQGQDYAQATKFCGRMQAIGYMEERQIKKDGDTVYQRRIRWRKNQMVFAKDRYIFKKDDAKGIYTIAAEGDVERTDMAEISRRIDRAMAETTVRQTAASKTSKKPAGKKPVGKAKKK
jgi:hypothetical protein